MEKLNSKIRITYQSINTSTKITKIEKTTEGFVIFGEGKKEKFLMKVKEFLYCCTSYNG